MSTEAKLTSHAALRGMVADLFQPKQSIYWMDFVFHVAMGWLCFSLSITQAGWVFWLCLVISIFSLYRAVIFTHELVHLKRGTFRGFTIVWDILCGIPLMVPSFLYDGVHQEHHFRNHYGTPEDGEYLPFGRGPRSLIGLYLVSHIVIPLLGVIRFALIAPLSWLLPVLRPLVLSRMSSLSIDPRYVRKVPTPVPKNWLLQEVACFIFAWTVIILTATQYLPWAVLPLWYLVAVCILLLNGVRTLVAHRYDNIRGHLSFDQQLLDSVNITGQSLLTPMMAPVGLRYHALHHLFPTMPYHHLGAAHRRLMRGLPADAAYKRTVEKSFWSAFKNLWLRSSRS